MFLVVVRRSGPQWDASLPLEEQSDWESIDKVAIRNGMTTMIEDGLAKCLSGMTSAAEILRVTTVR